LKSVFSLSESPTYLRSEKYVRQYQKSIKKGKIHVAVPSINLGLFPC